MEKDIKINIPAQLYKKINNYLEKTTFLSVDDFVIFVLQEYLDQKETQESTGLQQNEKEEIAKRLKDLGYM